MASEPTQHIIMVNGDGHPLDPVDKRKLNDSEFLEHIQSILDNIDARQPTNGKIRVLIFVHGGLNTLKTGLKRAKELYQQILDDGYYPIFINWRSGLVSSYSEYLLTARQGRTHRRLGPLTSPFFLVGDLGRGIAHAPVTWYHQAISDLKSTPIKPVDQKNSQKRSPDSRKLVQR